MKDLVDPESMSIFKLCSGNIIYGNSLLESRLKDIILGLVGGVIKCCCRFRKVGEKKGLLNRLRSVNVVIMNRYSFLKKFIFGLFIDGSVKIICTWILTLVIRWTLIICRVSMVSTSSITGIFRGRKFEEEGPSLEP